MISLPPGHGDKTSVATTHWSTLNGLMTFLAIVECGSINRAAAALHVTQPALSRALHQFEARVGGLVLTRSSKGVQLTPLGRSLLVSAQAIRGEMRNVERNAKAHTIDQSRNLSVGVVTVHPLIPFSRAVIALMERIPEARVQLIFGSAEEVLAHLSERRVDVAMAALVEGDEAAGLIQDVAYYDRGAIYCRPQHPLADTERVSIDDLEAARWIAGGESSFTREGIAHLFESQGRAIPPIQLEMEQTPMRRALVTQADFLSIFQIHHVHHEVKAGNLVQIRYDWPQEPQAIGAIRRDAHSTIADLFIKLIQSEYRSAGLPAQK